MEEEIRNDNHACEKAMSPLPQGRITALLSWRQMNKAAK